MPNFRFQTLLNYRERIVEDRQIEMAEAQRELVAIEAVLNQMQADRARYDEGLQRLMRGVLHIDEIDLHYRYLAHMDRLIEAQKELVIAAENAVEEARARLETALKERKTLEKLKEYDEQTFQAEQRQHEAKTLDDLNIVRYNRS